MYASGILKLEFQFSPAIPTEKLRYPFITLCVCVGLMTVALDRLQIPLSEHSDCHPRKMHRWAGAPENTSSKPGFECQIQSQVVNSQLFNFFRNRYHQWLSGIRCIQDTGFVQLLILPGLSPFHYWKANRGLKMPRTSRTRENDHFQVYGLWLKRKCVV